MKGQHEFDELIRARLQGLDLPMEDAHWRDMQRMIAAQRRRRRSVLLLLFGVLLGLGGGAWLYLQNNAAADQVAVEENTHSPIIEEKTKRALEQERTTNTIERTEAPEGEPGSHDEPATLTNAAPKPAAATPPVKRNASTPTPTRVGPDAAVAVTIAQAPTEQEGGTAEAGEGATPATVPPSATTKGPIPVSTVIAIPVDNTPVAANVAPTQETADTTVVPNADEEATAGAAAPNVMLGPDTLPMATVVLVVQDSAAPEPEFRLPSASTPFTWQITAAAGTWRTGLHARLPIDIALRTAQTAPSIGLEFMRMGDHIGYGSGVNYTEFVDRSEIEARSLIGTELRTLYFLSSVDTSITVVVDTIFQGGQNYYVTAQLDTTLLILDSDVDTLTTTTEVAGYTFVDRISVVEIPLLFDVHTRAGRWHMGLRAGPSLGYISGASIHVPGTFGPEPVLIEQSAFQRISFGYSARCYLRYALSSYWSVGIEPGIRGQFVDAGTGPSLRPFGYGLQGSVTFLLPGRTTIPPQ